jgi:hypothetical protein
MTNPKYLAKELNKRFASSDDGKAILKAYIDVGARVVINGYIDKYSQNLRNIKLFLKVVDRIESFVKHSNAVDKITFRNHLMSGYVVLMHERHVLWMDIANVIAYSKSISDDPMDIDQKVLDYTKVSAN